jgi:predicted NBD/HSP70 family sugar kinase
MSRPGLLFGVDVGGTKLRAALANLDGTILAELTEPTVRDSGAGLVERVAIALERLRCEVPAGPEVVAAGVALPVGVDPGSGRLRSTHNVPGLADVADIRAELGRALGGLPVAVDNDANAAALGERARGSAIGVDDLAVIVIGTGVGMGLIAAGRLIHGARGMAGELAFLPLGGDPFGRAALAMGTFEGAAAGPAIRERISAAVRSGARTSLPVDATFAEATLAAVAGDALAGTIVDEEARLVALAIAAVVAVVAPELVLLGGGVGSVPGLLEPVRAHLVRLIAEPPRVETSRLGDRAELVGAIELARSVAQAG